MLSKIVDDNKFKNVEFEERVLCVNRVTKVVKGGRIFSFSALVTIGNKNKYCGVGLGKSSEVMDARRKAVNDAKNRIFYAALTESGTIPHFVSGEYCASKIIMRPAREGTGIIGGGAVRLLLECLGVKDIVVKIIGSSNAHNSVKAAVNALLKLRSKKYFDLLKSGSLLK